MGKQSVPRHDPLELLGGNIGHNEQSEAEQVLANHRASIDRLDTILIYTLGERFNHTKAVGRLKAKHGLPTSDPVREAAQIDRLQRLAKIAGVDPAFAAKIISFIINEVIQHHKQHLQESQQKET